MSVVVVACLISLALLASCPASAAARIGPAGTPSVETMIPYQERTSTSAQDKQEVVETNIKIIQGKNAGSSCIRRRGLVGSSPPTCRSKCGRCTPCKAVHVAIGSPHGVISETEYYPEVWRCQCGNRYYMP
uniref:Epidermal patterning factor-like protein n=1 Tax=Physcomitrium patens TaxID=3218 RepID=A0A7I4BZ98_PHYPA